MMNMKFVLLNEDDFYKIVFYMLDLIFRVCIIENMFIKEDEFVWCMYVLYIFRGLIRVVGNMLINKVIKCCYIDGFKDL